MAAMWIFDFVTQNDWNNYSVELQCCPIYEFVISTDSFIQNWFEHFVQAKRDELGSKSFPLEHTGLDLALLSLL